MTMRPKGRNKTQKRQWDELHMKICSFVKIATTQKPLYGVSGDEIARKVDCHRNTVREHLKSDSNFGQIGRGWAWKPDYKEIQSRLHSVILELLRDGQAKIVPNVLAEERFDEEQRKHIRKKNMIYFQVSEDQIMKRLKVKGEILKEAVERGKDYRPRWIKADDFSTDSN